MPLIEKRAPTIAAKPFYAALVISLFALCVGLISLFQAMGQSSTVRMQREESALSRIKRTGVIRVGYGGFPPYTIVDPTQSDPNQRVTGFAIDMVREIAARHSPALKIEWYNLNWDTFRSDMLSGKFDFLADAVYETIPKAADFGMTDPFSYFGIAVAAVRIDDNRFQEFRDLDNPQITISLAQGYVSSEFAQRELSKPKFKFVSIGKDAFAQLDEVLLGRADVALNDVPTVLQYVRAHSTKMKALWIERPPSWTAASFVTRQEDDELRLFLNIALRVLKVDGTLARLDRKWASFGFFEKLDLMPGVGLSQPPAK